MNRASGILLHITSLPSPYGIGTLGKAAYAFGDFLCAAGQSYWQMLPVGPTGYGNSPYQSFSTFAGNPYLIDFDLLFEDGLLLKEEYQHITWGDCPERISYDAIYRNREGVLRKAFRRGWARDKALVEAFFAEQEGWLPDFALFMALKKHFGMGSWLTWEDEDIRLRRPNAIKQYKALLHQDIAFYIYVQYLFFSQWRALKEYLLKRNVRLIGDLPIYVSLDSADVWTRPENFLLQEDRRPYYVAGVPPDYFSSTGQLWGNPLYDWDFMALDGYSWWKNRLGAAANLFDVIRIDHFRGLESYWKIPFGETTAMNGAWEKGPGMDFLREIKRAFPSLSIIAEDLGDLTPAVHALLHEAGYPGMKVLQFAFNRNEPSAYLPHAYPRNCVCYTGTHDNNTAAGWLQNSPREAAYAREYLGLNEAEGLNWGLIRGGASSVADLFIAQMQDYLNLDESARMNTPSTLGENWRWRLLPGALDEALALQILRLTRMYAR